MVNYAGAIRPCIPSPQAAPPPCDAAGPPPRSGPPRPKGSPASMSASLPATQRYRSTLRFAAALMTLGLFGISGRVCADDLKTLVADYEHYNLEQDPVTAGQQGDRDALKLSGRVAKGSSRELSPAGASLCACTTRSAALTTGSGCTKSVARPRRALAISVA